jgi:hypothetical protein
MRRTVYTDQEFVTAVAFGDLGFLAKELKNLTMSKQLFIKLCKAAIDVNSFVSIEWLLNAYYQMWAQEVFDELFKYTRLKKNFIMLDHISKFVDKVNIKLEEMHIAQEKENEKYAKKHRVVEAVKKFSIKQWFKNLFKKK